MGTRMMYIWQSESTKTNVQKIKESTNAFKKQSCNPTCFKVIQFKNFVGFACNSLIYIYIYMYIPISHPTNIKITLRARLLKLTITAKSIDRIDLYIVEGEL